jgi:hypothetical protein
MKDDLEVARDHSPHRRHKKAIGIFEVLLQEREGDALIEMEATLAFDRVGRESEAAPLYKTALRSGLPEAAQRA